MSSRPFRLLIVADDRKTLRRLSRFLRVFGFHVDPIADGQQAIAVYEAHPPDFLIVDGDSLAMEHCRQLFSKSRNGYTYTFLMVRDVKAEKLTDALVAGVDDFLAKPLVYGELLARLRSGARVLEYERRMKQQSAIDHATALLSKSAFQARLDSELESAGDTSVACVMIDLDFFENVNRSHGYVVGDEVLRTVATQLKSMASECKYLASFGAGRFAAVLPDSSDAKALAWAENVREAIANLEVHMANQAVSITASLGVAGNMQGSATSTDLLQRAEDAVRMAKASGRNCVARCGQFDGETREWEDLARQGRLFETTVARDVMVPCPAFVRADDDLKTAAEMLEQSQLDELPVVDRQGRILGILGNDRLPEDLASSSRWRTKVGDTMDSNVKTVSESESFSALMEFFMDDSQSQHVVVVVRHDKPLGLVYRSGLAALSEPLNISSFAPDQPYSATSDYLVVRETW
jgi:two-component system cell cycle response regulator